jgi:hypothetical protein
MGYPDRVGRGSKGDSGGLGQYDFFGYDPHTSWISIHRHGGLLATKKSGH